LAKKGWPDVIKEISVQTAEQLLSSDRYKHLNELEDLQLNGPDLKCYLAGGAVVIIESVLGDSCIQIVPGMDQGELSEQCLLLKQLVENKGWLTLFERDLLDYAEFHQSFDVLRLENAKSFLFPDDIHEAPSIDIHIRRLTPNDEELAHAFECEEQLPYRRPSFAQLFDILVNRNQGAIYAYMLDGRIVGYLSAVPSYADAWDTDYICVLPEYRGHGIGLELAKAYAWDMRSRGLRAYWSNAVNEKSETVALKAGFRLVRESLYVEISRKK
ncbi:MAG: GNAT family N-acetyltransferase, partial [Limnochordia bacterium]